MRPGYNTKSITLRVPAVIMSEIQKRVREGYGQTEVILDALCNSFEIQHPRPRIPKPSKAARLIANDKGMDTFI